MDIILLDPRPQARAEMLALLNSAPTIGVEVTIPELAAACVANLDDQHGPDAGGTAAVYLAALLSGKDPNWAARWAADPDGKGARVAEAIRAGRYATIRPDRDSLGAIAVLSRPWSVLTREQMGRIRRIAEADSSAPRPGGPADPGTGEPDVFSALGFLAEDRAVPIEERVHRHWEWISTGTFDGVETYLERVRKARAEVAELERLVRVETVGDVRIAVISTTSRMGVVAAYRHADIVVAENPAHRWPQGHTTRKITICAQPGAPIALHMVERELNARQPGWGGQQWIKGSPQGVEPKASLDQVVRIVEWFTLGLVGEGCYTLRPHKGCTDPHPCEAAGCPCRQYYDMDGTDLLVAEPLMCVCGHDLAEHRGLCENVVQIFP